MGDPPLSHDESAIVTVNPPISDNLRRTTLNQIVRIVERDFRYDVVHAEISALGVGFITFTSVEIRDLLVRESPHPLDDETTFSFVRHDEGLNMRLPVFEYDAWIMMLAFPPDYLTDHYINKAVSLFGNLLLWHQPDESKSRVLVRALLKHVRLVPRSLLVTRVTTLAGHGMSWTVPVYVLNGRHTRQGLIDTEDPAPLMNASPHPYDAPNPSALQEYHLIVEGFNHQHGDQREVQLPVNEAGWGIWPEIPEVHRGYNMRELYGYEGPSMMDGVENSDNSSDDALEAWNDHVEEVEAAADGLLLGSANTTLVFVRAGGAIQSVFVPTFPCFLSFLGWMMRQVYTRYILPAELASPQVVFRDFLTQFFDSMQTAVLENALFARPASLSGMLAWSDRQLDQHTVTPHFELFAESQMARPSSADDWMHGNSNSSVLIEELQELRFITEDENLSENEVIEETNEAQLANVNPFQPIELVAPPVDATQIVEPAQVVEPAQYVAPPARGRGRGRPRCSDTPTVVSQVRRSTRNNNDGFMPIALPDRAPRRRSCTVAPATAPEVMQIAEMQRVGVEDCNIDPGELTEARLR